MKKTMLAGAVALLALAGCTSTTSDKLAAGTTDTASQSKVISGSSGNTGTSGSGSPGSTKEPGTTVPEGKPIELTGNGFTQLPKGKYSSSSYVTYGIVISNPNSDMVAESVKVNTTFTNASGTVVKSASDTISLILPGQQAALGSSAEADGVTKMEVKILPGKLTKPKRQVGQLTTSGVTAKPGDVSTKITGEVASTFEKDLQQVKTVAIAYNAAGEITGGQFTYVDFVPAGGKASFEMSASNWPTSAAKVEAIANVTSLTLLGD